jgi:hypothetical protein
LRATWGGSLGCCLADDIHKEDDADGSHRTQPTETRTNNPKEIQSTEKLGLDFWPIRAPAALVEAEAEPIMRHIAILTKQSRHILANVAAVLTAGKAG